jgi:hypothetical protein
LSQAGHTGRVHMRLSPGGGNGNRVAGFVLPSAARRF